jgi:hypothetical protein
MGNPDEAGAGSVAYMHMMGIVALGHMWLVMAGAAQAALAAGEDEAFHGAKLVTARYYAERFLPDTASLRARLEAGSATMMAMPAHAF